LCVQDGFHILAFSSLADFEGQPQQDEFAEKLAADVPVAGTAIWYDPATGNTVATLPVTAGRHTLHIPDFVTDMALKISAGR